MAFRPYSKVSEIELTGRTTERTPEQKLWSGFKNPQVIDTIGPVYCVAFNPCVSHEYSVGNGSDILMFDSTGSRKRISKSKETITTLGYRSDGRLLASGAENGLVRIYDAVSRSVMRTLKGHKKAVRSVQFGDEKKTTILTSSDDLTIKIWDYVSEIPMVTLEGYHIDYIRSALFLGPNMIVSGSYDGTVALWDIRNPKPVYIQKHLSPVENLAVDIGNGIVYSCGGVDIKAWNINCLEPLFSFSPHQKTITSIFYDSKTRSIISGSLDHHIKITRVSEKPYLEYSFTYPSQILSFGLANDYCSFVVGLSNGSFVIRSNTASTKIEMMDNMKKEVKEKRIEEELVIVSDRPVSFGICDQYLKSFQYRKAFDVVFETQDRGLILAVFEELYHRNALHIALADKDSTMVKSICSFVLKYVSIHTVSRLLCVVCMHLLGNLFVNVLDLYGSKESTCGILDETFRNMKERISSEIEIQRELMSIGGTLEMIMASGNTQ